MYLLPEGFEKRLLASISFSEEEEPSINRIKSDRQRKLEEKGWKFIVKVRAKNDFMDYTENRESFRLFKVDCQRKYAPNKEIELIRADDAFGNIIDPCKKIMDVYARDKE